MPVVSPKPISVAPASANCSAMSSTRSIGTLPSYGQPNEVAITAQKVRLSATMRLAITLTSAMVSSTVRLMFRWLWVSEALTKSATSSNRSRTSSALSRPWLFGTSTIRATSCGRSMPREHLHAIGQLRDDVGPNEARDLDPLEAGAAQRCRSAGSCPRSRSSPVRSGSRRGARPPGCAPAGSRPRCDYRPSRHDLPVHEAPLEPLSMMRRRHRDESASPFRDGAAGQQRDAVLGDDGVDVGRARS